MANLPILNLCWWLVGSVCLSSLYRWRNSLILFIFILTACLVISWPEVRDSNSFCVVEHSQRKWPVNSSRVILCWEIREFHSLYILSPSTGAVQYTDSISAEGLITKSPLPTRVLAMTLDNLIVRLQSWSLGNVDYSFVAITSRSTLTQNDNICLGPTDRLNSTNRLQYY